MSRADEVIHQTVRLRLMSTLSPLPLGEAIEFNRLKEILGVTSGNLGAHLATLEGAGYVEIIKDYLGKRPRTRIAMTSAGKKAYDGHVAFLRAVLEHGG
jgi:DNA-binding MarR family transcriptional regulator